MKSSKEYREEYLDILSKKFGKMTKLGRGYTLFYIDTPDIIVYFRFSKIYYLKGQPYKSFYGLVKEDIDIIKSSNKKSFLIFLTSQKEKNLFIPFNQFENLFEPSKVERDGHYKVNYFFRKHGDIINFSKIGKYSTELFSNFDSILDASTSRLKIPVLTHGQIQSLVGAIGSQQGYELFFPSKDLKKIDYSIVNYSNIIEKLPNFNNVIDRIIKEVDVIWLKNNIVQQLFEVEHSTPIYSGLLRFNDIFISIKNTKEFNIVAEDKRESKFSLEINRPTFSQNKLVEKTTFISYESIYKKYFNLTGKYYGNTM